MLLFLAFTGFSLIKRSLGAVAHGSATGEQRVSLDLRNRGIRGLALVQVCVTLRSGRIAIRLLGLHDYGVGVAPSHAADTAGAAAAAE